jgi:hypothetical protein
LGFCHHWSLGLRRPHLKGSLTSLGYRIHRVVVFLGDGITDILIESVTLASTHRLPHLRGKSPLEASNLFIISIDHLRGIPGKIVEGLEVLIHALIALSQLNKLNMLDFHSTRRNVVTPESSFELVPNDLNISREGILMMIPPDTCSSLQLVPSKEAFMPLVTLSNENFCSMVLSHSSACSGSSASLNIGGLVSIKSLKELY